MTWALSTAGHGMYLFTQFIIGSTFINVGIGVKQGSPTSCFLFILFVDEFIRLIKSRCLSDGFLEWLHLLMLMDDTVVLAASRQRLCEKLNVLSEWCNESGMIINEDKTEFMVFSNSNDTDREPIPLSTKFGIINMTHCSQYI